MRVHLLAAVVSLLAAASAHSVPLPRFPPGAVWNQDISLAPVSSESANQIATLAGLGGFGNGRMQVDFSFKVVNAAAGSPTRVINGYSFDNYYEPDCEAPPVSMPVPVGAAIEGQPGLSCPNDPDGEDCHLLVVQGRTLYEAYKVNALSATELDAQCLAVWNLDFVYPPQGRGEHCTSADAAGFPIAALLFNADEVAAAIPANGDLGHAIRFILPNPRIARDFSLPGSTGGRLYVRPASHAGGPTGPVGTVAYGSRLRLRADFPFTNYNAAAQVILRTMQRYGIVLSDGGNIALTAEADDFTTAKWSDLGITAQTFYSGSAGQDVAITDFAVIDTGPRIAEDFNCVRTVVPFDILFSDGFE
jgi:serine/threonine-protein kinase